MALEKEKVLIDADITAYQVCSAAEIEWDWGDDIWSLITDFKEVKRSFRDAIDTICEVTEADGAILCFTSPDNFRQDILPSYKGNRKTTRKPMNLAALRDWTKDEYEVAMLPRLEGDDCLGILAGLNPNYFVYSADKDMKTLPVRLWSQDDRTVYRNSETIADWYWMSQTLSGDATDGYKGCPGIGPKRAADILGEPGQRDLADLWERVVSAYEKAKLTEDDAVVQAQVARILRHTDYNLDTGEITTWTPTIL